MRSSCCARPTVQELVGGHPAQDRGGRFRRIDARRHPSEVVSPISLKKDRIMRTTIPVGLTDAQLAADAGADVSRAIEKE